MQEAIAELALNELPLVIFNMARNQQDYFQATRGGGWGDYRTLTLAPKDVPEAVSTPSCCSIWPTSTARRSCCTATRSSRRRT